MRQKYEEEQTTIDFQEISKNIKREGNLVSNKQKSTGNSFVTNSLPYNNFWTIISQFRTASK